MFVAERAHPPWSFLTNHAQVLACIAGDARERRGRRNHFTIQSQQPLPDPLARGQKVSDLLRILAE